MTRTTLRSFFASLCPLMVNITLLAGLASLAQAGPVFVLVASDGQSLLTAELQNGKAVITNTQALTPSVGLSTYPVITYADDAANPYDVYGLRNDNRAIIQADASDGSWTDGGYGVVADGFAYDDIAYDGGGSQMYGTSIPNQSGQSLWRINGPAAGDQVQVGLFPSSGAFQEIAIDETTGQMYGTDISGQQLYTINKADATWSSVALFTAQGSGDSGFFTDITFTLDGQLYGMNTTAIYEIDKATAVYNPTFFPIEDSLGNPVTVAGHFAAVPEPTAVATLGCAVAVVGWSLRGAARRLPSSQSTALVGASRVARTTGAAGRPGS